MAGMDYRRRFVLGSATVEPETMRQSMADMAWWFGWNAAQIDALTVTEFIDWQEQITRQVKAGYSKI